MNTFYLSLLWERMRTWRLRSFERLPASTLQILLCPRLRICSWTRLERRPRPTCGMIYDAFAEVCSPCLHLVQLFEREEDSYWFCLPCLYLVQLVVADVESDELDLVSESWLCGGMGEGHDNVDDGHDLVLDICDLVDNDT